MLCGYGVWIRCVDTVPVLEIVLLHVGISSFVYFDATLYSVDALYSSHFKYRSLQLLDYLESIRRDQVSMFWIVASTRCLFTTEAGTQPKDIVNKSNWR